MSTPTSEDTMQFQFVCNPEEAPSWSDAKKAEFIRWYEASQFSTKIPGAGACYDICKGS
jgi:hypothetical protein